MENLLPSPKDAVADTLLRHQLIGQYATLTKTLKEAVYVGTVNNSNKTRHVLICVVYSNNAQVSV